MAPLARRICLAGAESTGKSELARELARHFGAPLSDEFAREYALRVARPLTYDDVEPIGRGQMANEDRVAGPAILDTDLVSTVVYSRYYYGECPEWIERAARERLADIYLLMDVDVPWREDAARDGSANRDDVHALFKKTLERFGANYVVISGDWDERRRKAIQAAR